MFRFFPLRQNKMQSLKSSVVITCVLFHMILQVKADLHFQQLKVKFLLESSVLPQNRVGFGLLLSRRILTFNYTAFWLNLTFN